MEQVKNYYTEKNKSTFQKNKIIMDEIHGKLPPQAIDLERAVLGAILIEKGKDVTALDILNSESFYKDSHQRIFRAIIKLSADMQPIDYFTVIDQLKKSDELEAAGGAQYIIGLTENIGSGAHLEYHAKIIAEKAMKRELIRISSEIQHKSYDETEDVYDLLESAQQKVFDLALGSIKKDTEKIDSILEKALEKIDELSKKEDSLSGTPSGFSSLDRITSGWQASDLVIIAARPSMGKTAFVLSMTRNMAVEHNQAIAIFSLEMSSVQLVNRLISSETELGSDKIRTGRLKDNEWTILHEKLTKLGSAKIHIDDTPAISLFELRSKCRKLKQREDINLVIIDYLQLMTGPPETKGNREQEVSMISRGLKAIAKELDLPIIALSQLNRSVEMRSGEKRPQLSDLRESGAIEQDADIVMFIHRPEKMGLLEDGEGNSTKGLAEIIIAKHRNGAVTDVKLRFREEFARFEEFDNVDFYDSDNFINTIPSSMNSSDNEFNPSKEFEDINNNDDDEPPF